MDTGLKTSGSGQAPLMGMQFRIPWILRGGGLMLASWMTSLKKLVGGEGIRF
jgi:hypothetical protein